MLSSRSGDWWIHYRPDKNFSWSQQRLKLLEESNSFFLENIRSQYMSVNISPEKLSDFRQSNNWLVKAGYTQKLPKDVSLT